MKMYAIVGVYSERIIAMFPSHHTAFKYHKYLSEIVEEDEDPMFKIIELEIEIK